MSQQPVGGAGVQLKSPASAVTRLSLPAMVLRRRRDIDQLTGAFPQIEPARRIGTRKQNCDRARAGRDGVDSAFRERTCAPEASFGAVDPRGRGIWQRMVITVRHPDPLFAMVSNACNAVFDLGNVFGT